MRSLDVPWSLMIGLMVAPGNRTRASAVGVRRHNHHATNYSLVPNFTVHLSPLPSPGLQPYLPTKWTGQTRLTNSQAATHENWLARCSPHTPGFNLEQFTQLQLSSKFYSSFIPTTKSRTVAISIHQVDRADTFDKYSGSSP